MGGFSMNSPRNSFFGLSLTMILATLMFASYALPPASTAVRNFEFTYLVRIPQLPPEAHALHLWIPLPQSDSYQTISDLTIDSPIPYSRHRESQYHNEYLYLQPTATQLQHPVEVLMRFRVARREHRVSLDPSVDPPGTPPTKVELARYLRPDRLIPLNGVIADLSRQETQGVTEPLAKARKIYDYVVATMRYEKSGTGWGHGDAIWACTAKYGNCTDFHSLFIGMARAAGIPARFEIGFPLPENQHEGTIAGYHCWAEFYVQPYGWIPVDASEAWKYPDKRDYFFGAHDANRVQFTMGRDIRLDPAQQGERLNYFIYPYAEVNKKPFTALDYKFTFRDVGKAN
jgi:transglutaminase-like putative cysteine protease